jgi:hypothetical protein
VSVTYVAGPKNAARHRTRSVTYVAGHLSPMLPNETVTDVPACTLWVALCAQIDDLDESNRSQLEKRLQRANERVLDEKTAPVTTSMSSRVESSSSSFSKKQRA